MSTDAKSAPPRRKLTAADVAKIPRVLLFDEKNRWWGFVTSNDASMLSQRTAAEWYALGRQLLAERPGPHGTSVVIPYHEEYGGEVVGRFVLTPWSDRPATQPSFTEQEIDELEAMCNDKSQMMSFDEFKESVIQMLQEDGSENGRT